MADGSLPMLDSTCMNKLNATPTMAEMESGRTAGTVTPSSARVPLHRRIADDLRAEIRDVGPGGLLPSEHELMRRYAVSRGTIRQARAALRAEGVISGSQGKLLEVPTLRLTQPFTQLISFSAWAESLGLRPSAVVIESGMQTASAEASAALGIAAGSPIFHVLRLRLADGQPLMIERTSFAPSLVTMLTAMDLTKVSIYAALAEKGIVFTSARHQIGAIACPKLDAPHLGTSPGAPLLRVRRVAFSASGEALEWSDDRFRADRVDFAIENTPASAISRRIDHLAADSGSRDG